MAANVACVLQESNLTFTPEYRLGGVKLNLGQVNYNKQPILVTWFGKFEVNDKI